VGKIIVRSGKRRKEGGREGRGRGREGGKGERDIGEICGKEQVGEVLPYC
jgi:hypothetical protein